MARMALAMGPCAYLRGWLRGRVFGDSSHHGQALVGLLAYGLMALAVIGAAAGFYGKIHHDGYVEGKGEVQQAWDSANAAAQKKAEADRLRQDALRQAQEQEATRRLADEKKRSAGLMASLEAHIRASGTAVQCPIPPSLFDDWNLSNAGPKGAGPGTVPATGPKPTPPR